MEKILILGAAGQVGIDLTEKLIEIFGTENVIASDLKIPENPKCKFLQLDALDKEAIKEVIIHEKITTVYHLVAMLSATGEKKPLLAWKLNMDTLFTILEFAKEGLIKKIFWPSSIAIFGPTTPKINTPQSTIIEPTTIYGISKYAGELLCQWYYQKHKVDVRSVRYPGLISWKAEPGGGTTDYAVEIFYEALRNKSYTCFLKEDTRLPMMYIDDAIEATIRLMTTEAETIKTRTSYNISAFDFTPSELAALIKKHIPDFQIRYSPDFRQNIADSWPQSIDDTQARQDWNWNPRFTLEKMVSEMLSKLTNKLKV
ncbi:L-threonine 3-dehydrogenase [Thermaurantimonas aggregans]|uniref:L-threonine 3-dehydrogenase n=1 Tax=Thermaurantimonas aggregans TaxID=2173829 RepID=A0A401XKW9_9FLAO|nr:NAD-dependent epimerase/dehydratase family protein [Thermaurantimonas aggregans]MCX8148240.1 NAD-dependent epimerase/dehydratase family protein [Thermaurantimonas aggregans]GCD77666.1 L-threonine 3-dehydrogenase [Thermaurantimonas aggregans]